MTLAWQFESVRAGPGDRDVLQGVTIGFRSGELTGVLGPNGAGKTTLLRAGLGLLPLHGGEVQLSGRSLASLSEQRRARLCGYLPQDRRIGWNMATVRVVELGAPDLGAGAARTLALDCLAKVGMQSVADRGVMDLSGGERGRALLARLLATRARLLVADEPVAGLDPDAQFLALELLALQARAGAAVVVTLHDLNLAVRLCHRLVVLDQGRMIAEGLPREVLTGEILRSVFGLEGELIETQSGLTLAARRLDI